MHEIPFKETAMQQLLKQDEYREYIISGKPYMRVLVRKKWLTLMLRINTDNQRINKKIGTYPDMSLTAFEAKADTLYRHYKGIDRFIDPEMTLAEYFCRVYAQHAKQHKRSYKDDISRYKNHIHNSALARTALIDITTVQARRFFDDLPEYLSVSTKRNIRSLVSATLTMACNDGYIQHNPCQHIRIKQPDNVKRRVLTDQEVTRFHKAAWAKQSHASALSLLIALFTGGRIGNVISIKKSDISLDYRSLVFPETKSGKSQTVYLPEDAIPVIQQAIRLSGDSIYLFPSARSDKKHISYPRTMFQIICKEAGIPTTAHPEHAHDSPSEPVSIHSLRKTVATALLNETADPFLCRDLLGHSDIRVTQKYAFPDKQRLRQGINSIFQNIRNAHAVP